MRVRCKHRKPNGDYTDGCGWQGTIPPVVPEAVAQCPACGSIHLRAIAPSEPPPPRMTRAQLETLKSDLANRYVVQLVDANRYSDEDCALMLSGFETGVTWLLQTIEAAGFKVDP